MEAEVSVGGDFADVAYKVVDGTRTMPWSDVDPYAVAEGLPWRRYPWYLGQRNYSGMYWCATEAKLVGYESLLELSRLILADFDRPSKRIAEILSRPVDQRFQATSDPAFDGSASDVSGVMSTGRSSSLPLWNTAPARTRATRCGALRARQRACAASISL